jgi:ankyrin repeat protein
LDAGADLVKFGPEALVEAVKLEQWKQLPTLLERGVAVNALGEYLSPLQVAASLKTLDMAYYLFSQGADVNKPAYRHSGRTALQSTYLSGNLAMVELLIENQALVNGAPALADGVTSLEAVTQSRAELDTKKNLFVFLLEHGADVRVRGHSSPAPLSEISYASRF